MPKTATQESVLRVILPAPIKREFQQKCAASGQNMSERTRQLIIGDLQQAASPAERFQAILASAKKKAEASALPELSIEDIDAFIEEVRDERIAQGRVS